MNRILSEALMLLADLHENSLKASDRTAKLDDLLADKRSRYYYEALLERSPERSAVANSEVPHPMFTLREFMASDEFAANHMRTLRDLFPDRSATFFLHIPKTGGSTVCESMERSRRFVWLLMPDSIGHGGGDERLSYYGGVVSRLRNSNKDFTIGGHATASLLLNTRLKKPDDRVFTVVRDPCDLMISWLNYLLTIVYTELPSNPDFAGRPDAKRVDDLIGHDWCSGPISISDAQIELLVENVTYRNPICRSIGAEPTFVSAIDTLARLDIEVIPFHGISQFCEKNGFPSSEDRNISVKFIKKSTLRKSTLEMIYDRIGEDLKFYSYVESTDFR